MILDHYPGVKHVVSVSGGKDSTPTLLLAIELHGLENVVAAFADTGNEHELTLEYVDYLGAATGVPIVTLRADFTEAWAHRIDYVSTIWPEKLIAKDGYNQAEATALIARVLDVLERGPTGIPYLDLCIIKGRFPSRMAQFCTQELKTIPLVNFQMSLIDSGEAAAVWSWQGIRADEGGRRRWAKEFEAVGDGLYIHRPILRWSAADCFEAHAAYGIKPNPLYSLGMGRVGCMPCINAKKLETRAIAARFPAHIDRIEEWESLVAQASKRGRSSFFPAPQDGRLKRGNNIRDYIRWTMTGDGGKTFDLFADAPQAACASSYGLCDKGD